MGKGPSEVWRDNCFVGASFMRPHEVPLRDRIGLDKIMWGSDYPHDEGTYPYSREGLRIAYAGLPREEIAAMVGGNAARVYGFDLALLDPSRRRSAPRWRSSPNRWRSRRRTRRAGVRAGRVGTRLVTSRVRCLPL